MKRILLALAGALALLVPHAPARAQLAYAQTVSACGTPNNTPVVGNSYPLTMDTTGKLCTPSSGGGTSSTFGAAFPATGTAAGFKDSTGTNMVAGNLGSQTTANSIAVAIASDQAAVAVKNDAVLDAATQTASVTSATTVLSLSTVGYSSGSFQMTSLGSGNTITFEISNDNTNWTAWPVASSASGEALVTTWTSANGIGFGSFSTANAAFIRARVSTYGSGTVTITSTLKRTGPAITAITAANSNGVVIQGGGGNAVSTTATLATTGGWTPKLLNALTNTAVAVKASGGQLGMLQCYNPNGTQEYVQVYNIASGSVTVGTSTPLESIAIAPTSTGGFVSAAPGQQFGTAIAVAATTTATGGSAPSTALDCNASYN